jgi:hypothetical protein
MTIEIPRPEDLLQKRLGIANASDLKDLAREMYLNGTLDHVPVQWISTAMVEKWHPDKLEWVQKKYGSEMERGKYERDELYTLVGAPDEYTEDPPSNLLLNNGISRLIDLLDGVGSVQAYSNGVARIGVGTATAVEAAGQADLSATAVTSTAVRYFQRTSSVTTSAQTQVCVSTFGTANGNFVWAEWGIDALTGADGAVVGLNTATSAALLNRKVAALGTKASGSSWTITTNITIS